MISNERAHFSACIGAYGILMTYYQRKRQIKEIFFHYYFFNVDILLINKVPVMKCLHRSHKHSYGANC